VTASAEPARPPRERAPLGIYLHVPFCASRCGYCAFNTVTVADAGVARVEHYPRVVEAELALAARALGGEARSVSTVFVGGGTPTVLAPDALVAMLRAVERELGLDADAEITVEANPDSVDERVLAALRAGGFTRVSFGMQSIRSHVLAVLDRSHTPGRALDAVTEAHRAGFEHVNLDLIYGTPGERDDDWAATVDAAIASGVDHVSAYALTLEPGTKLTARARHGRLPALDDEALAVRYELADERLIAAGFAWYELSNWARGDGAVCRHNLGYWRGHDWIGIGPGAHSHLDGRRWANERNLQRHADAVLAGRSPACDVEDLDDEARRLESLLTGIRLAEGCAADLLDGRGRRAAAGLVDDGLLDAGPLALGRLRLTDAGRQLADHVVARLA
jgi:putative oxygen-independent coproporphyrinogen III oxidase